MVRAGAELCLSCFFLVSWNSHPQLLSPDQSHGGLPAAARWGLGVPHNARFSLGAPPAPTFLVSAPPGTECWKGLARVSSGNSLAACMADGSMLVKTPPTGTPEGHCPL